MKKKTFSLKSLNPLKSLISPISLMIAFLIAVFSFFAGTYYQKQISQSGQSKFPTSQTTTRVIDGDTIELSNEKHVRLTGISTPDFGKPFYEEAKKFTEGFVLNKEITLEYEEKYKEDAFGRILAYVVVDGKNLNIELVRNGLAEVVIYQKRAKLIYQDELLKAQEEAKKEKLGIWTTN